MVEGQQGETITGRQIENWWPAARLLLIMQRRLWAERYHDHAVERSYTTGTKGFAGWISFDKNKQIKSVKKR